MSAVSIPVSWFTMRPGKGGGVLVKELWWLTMSAHLRRQSGIVKVIVAHAQTPLPFPAGEGLPLPEHELSPLAVLPGTITHSAQRSIAC
ncbi:hypothetical protein RRG08_064121 [Elysia crispata]|uniref:Uncharacterized protein n=1 Tax=Elysia crispata TaxID=231223 RepID=A0AAE1DZB2_9GAST|nr:hypothetical protein RRG08_064121 [Elysia crispata]